MATNKNTPEVIRAFITTLGLVTRDSVDGIFVEIDAEREVELIPQPSGSIAVIGSRRWDGLGSNIESIEHLTSPHNDGGEEIAGVLDRFARMEQ